MSFKLIESPLYKGFYFSYFSNDYLVSRDGKILRSDGKKPWIRTDISNERAFLLLNDNKTTMTVSKLVCMTFNSDTYFKGANIFHIDGNKRNAAIENLKWISKADIQTNRVMEQIAKDIKEFDIPTNFNKENGLFPKPIECKFKKGYYYIPFSTSPIVVDVEGKLFNLKTNEEIYPFNGTKDYDLVVLRYEREFKSTQVHRIVAMLFCKIPDKHIDKTIKKLQINHIDGDKKNNKRDNLEWCDGFENMRHARENGLFSNQNPMLTKNLKTGEMKKYFSVSECAKQNGLHHGNLFFHLKSKSSGRVAHNGVLFKLDDGSPWPKLLLHEKVIEHTPLARNCDLIALNVKTGEKHLFYSIIQACDVLGLNRNIVVNRRQRYGHDVPYNDYIFYFLTNEE